MQKHTSHQNATHEFPKYDHVCVHPEDDAYRFIDQTLLVQRGAIRVHPDTPKNVREMIYKYVASGHIYPVVYMTGEEYTLAKLRRL